MPMQPIPPPPDPLWIWLTEGNAPGYLAFIGAVVAASIAWRSSNASRRSAQLAQRERDDRDAAQARQVLATKDSIEVDGRHEQTLVVKNYSTELLTMVEAIAVGAPELPPGFKADWRGSPSSEPHIARVLPPGESFAVRYEMVWRPAPAQEGPSVGPPERPPIRFWTMTVEYTDARGLRWRRTGNTPPERIIAAAPKSMWSRLRAALGRRKAL